ncbi:LysE family translocator [Dokdonia sp. Hel_I_53]|uniref:LysE family translocator n=1 Tax=Dokdonia sp. Hel_I_53 TaxID=1566287 RepID=UPI00119C17DD|nr:LysE family translocator [Dokdonia sp. Hel_I_53]TVZ51144.1 threonine/homoserine/homoserine lactone efflux protein [Dokdonia sp. Hel_I_53]
MTESILAFIAATAILAFSPGPDNIYVLTQSVVNGSRSGLATTAGLITGCIVHTTLVAFGISAVIATSPHLFLAIKIAGAAYLLYIAYKVYGADAHITLAEGAPKKSYSALFKQGIIMNILNPKVTIFFLAFFPGFLWDPNDNTVYQFYTLGFIFMLESFIIFGGIALVAGRIAPVLKRNDTAGILLKWLQIFVFIGIAIFILF